MAVIDGVKIAAGIKAQIAKKVRTLARPPGLATILVGNHPAAEIYVHNKNQACLEVGFRTFPLTMPSTIDEDALCGEIDRLNDDNRIDGILVQLPLPAAMDANSIIGRIRPDKDVDGFHPQNIGLLAQKKPFLRPCTPKGVMVILHHIGVNPAGLDAAVIGASNIVGRPLALELLNARASVAIFHSKTKNLAQKIKRMDLVISATGQAEMVKGGWIKKGAVVIDVGITRRGVEILGDVDFAAAQKSASWITPVPGGVGPMTVAMLLENTLQAYEARRNGEK